MLADWQVQQPGQSRLRGGRGRGPGGDQGAHVHHGAADAAAARRAQAQRSTQPAILVRMPPRHISTSLSQMYHSAAVQPLPGSICLVQPLAHLMSGRLHC